MLNNSTFKKESEGSYLVNISSESKLLYGFNSLPPTVAGTANISVLLQPNSNGNLTCVLKPSNFPIEYISVYGIQKVC
jgi:hypothetical protein